MVSGQLTYVHGGGGGAGQQQRQRAVVSRGDVEDRWQLLLLLYRAGKLLPARFPEYPRHDQPKLVFLSIESSDWRAWDPISPTTCTDARVAHGMTRPRRGHTGAVWRSIHLGRTPCNAAPSPEGILVVPARFVAQTLEKVPIVVTIVRAAATLLFSGCVAFCRFSDLAPAPTFAAATLQKTHHCHD